MSMASSFRYLRRRRFGLSLAICYVFLANLFAMTLADLALANPADPASLLTAMPLCRSAGQDNDTGRHIPAGHELPCMNCGVACPMGGCAPATGSVGAVLAVIPPLASANGLPQPRAAGPAFPQRIYLSDAPAQAPPARS
ncbi:hypothetical protein [Dongia mobilis]|jgi:hypothetical protein|uniref:hypothetical protein n=1 Tax=Dongia sp. TaxID=1977262 RepID=UPI0026ECEA07